MPRRPYLNRLAEELGILPSYLDAGGTRTHVATDETRMLLVNAMGYAASTEAEARAALAALRSEQAARVVDPVYCVSVDSSKALTLPLRLPAAVGGRKVSWTARLISEDGAERRWEGNLRTVRGRASLRLDSRAALSMGYYRLQWSASATGFEHHAEPMVIVAPSQCLTLREVHDGSRPWGLWTNLYSVRSQRNWGVGDFTDLAQLARWAGTRGAAFVGVNPLHALRNEPGHVSPYSPISRLFRNLVYVDVEAIKEFKQSREAQRLVGSPTFQEELRRLRKAPQINYERIAALKMLVVDLLYDEFLKDPAGGRLGEYATYLHAQGEKLFSFAAFVAWASIRRRDGRDGFNWRGWPDAARLVDARAVQQFHRQHQRAVDLASYVQMELDRQLRIAARAAKRAGLKLGIYNDLALGSALDSADVWSNQAIFALDVTVGAPPDPLAPHGQDWNFPPVDPHRLRASGYAYWRALLESNCRHAGMLRIDHILGLFRQFWIPRGRPASQGAYVRYPANDLLAVLALESHRHRTVIVGEDLGTVPKDVPRELVRRGILSMRVLTFERTRAGAYRKPADAGRHAALYASTHDTAPLAAFWKGADVRLRDKTGGFASKKDFDSALTARTRDRGALLRRLRAERLLPKDGEPSIPEIVAAIHRFLARTPAPLIAIALDDLANEVEPVNVPGVGPKRHASWTRKMRRSLAEITTDREVRDALRALDGAMPRTKRKRRTER